MYKIELRCDFEELWRFNIAIAAATLNSDCEQQLFKGAQSITNENFQNTIVPFAQLEKIPEHKSNSISVEIESDQNTTALNTIIYFIAHTLPENRDVTEQPPFTAYVTISKEAEIIYKEEHEVNRWGGATININL